ncbi:MAG: hypothetical protein AB7P76_08140 [Candidatus Melainabacteria bacterium]
MASNDPAEQAAFYQHRSVEALIAQQRVQPVQSLEALRGDFWPEAESMDDFVETIRRWRQEGTPAEGLL